MEYNIDGMAPQQPNIFKRAWQNITLPHYGRTIGFLTLLVIILAIPATITFLYKPTNLQQKAAEQLPSDYPSGKIEVFNGRGDAALAMNGNVAINSTSNAIQLKITAPQGSTLGQAETVKFAANQKQSIIPQAYAATLCSSPRKCSYYKDAGCSYANDNAADQQCQGENPALEAGGEDSSITNSLCWICNGGSSPTATPTPASGSGGSCSTYNNNCGGCLNQPACAYTDGGQCVSVDPNRGNICPAGKTTWYWANCSTNECTGGGGGSSAKCTQLTIPTATIRAGDPLLVSPNFTGQPAAIQFWIASNNTTSAGSASWTNVKVVQNPRSRFGETITNTQNFNEGNHLVLMQLLDSQGNVLDDQQHANCLSSITISGSTGGSSPTTTPTPAAGSGIFPANGARITGNSVQLRWNAVTETPYHVRVKNVSNPTAGFAAGVSREAGCPNDLFVCTETGTNNWLDMPLSDNGQYQWWVDNKNWVQIATGTFEVYGFSGGGGTQPTATPTTAPASPSTQIVKIDIQNLPDSDQSGSPVKTITDAVQLSRILHGTEKVGWNLALPDFTQDLTTQDKTVEVTFWYAGNRADGKNYVKTTQVVKYAPFAMRFSTDAVNVEPQVRQPLYVYVYGTSAARNVKLHFENSKFEDISMAITGSPDAASCGPSPCGVISNADSKTIAWKFKIPNDEITEGVHVISFLSDTGKHVTEAVTVLPEGGTPTATPTPPGARTPGGLGTPTATPTPAAGSGIFPANGARITGNSVQLRWNAVTETPYHVRVKNMSNPTSGFAAGVSREAGCPNDLFVCTETGTNNWLDMPLSDNGQYQWWVDNKNWVQIANGTFEVYGFSGGGGTQPTATPTVAPTATPIPTPTSSVTPPPPGPASVNFKVILAGIGVKANKGSDAIVNDRPNRRRRDTTLYLYEPGVDATGDFVGAKTINNGAGKIAQPEAIIYDNDGKFVAANFNLGNTFRPGQYQVFVWTPGYLRKRIPSIQTFSAGANVTNTISQVVTLKLGDANNDNELNTLDFREYRSCLNQQTTTCLKADFNDDGYVDNDDKHSGKEGNNKPSYLDYNLFVSEFAIVSGD